MHLLDGATVFAEISKKIFQQKKITKISRKTLCAYISDG